MRALLFNAAFASALLIPMGGGRASDPLVPQTVEPRAGEGVLCLWALTSTAAEVGRRCPNGDPDLQAALDESVARLDRYVAVNGPASGEMITAFKRRQGGVDEGIATLCSTDKLRLYREMHSQGVAALRTAVDKAIARAGTPAWGDCL